jgi:hypothetical protein
LLEAVSNDRPRGMVATSKVLDFGPYRTRLTGRLTPSFHRPEFCKKAEQTVAPLTIH